MNILKMFLICLWVLVPSKGWSYGTSYFEEERPISLSGWSFSARLGTDLSNPYLETYSGHFGAHYFWSERWGVQAVFQQSWSDVSDLNNAIEQDFEMNGLATRNRRPEETIRAGLEVTPLFGRLNFFSVSVVDFRVNTALGLGLRSFSFGDDAVLAYWSLEPQVRLSESVWAQLVFQQNTVEIGQDQQFTESEVQLGTRILF